MATKYYLGTAGAIKQIDRITMTGTWSSTETITMTINGNDLVITLGNASSNANVAKMMSAALNSATRDYSKIDSETVNTGGQSIPEFMEVKGVYDTGSSPDYFDVEAKVNGKPFTMTVSDSSGTGTATLSSQQANTGPWNYDNADNWSDGAVPGNGDTLWFDERAANSCKYGFPDNSGTLGEITLGHITMGFAGKQFGLSAVNRDNSSKPYTEYRQLGPKYDDRTVAGTPTWRIGEGSGGGPRYVYIEQHDIAGSLQVLNSGAPLDGEQYVVHYHSATAATPVVVQNNGSVALSGTPGTTGQYSTIVLTDSAQLYASLGSSLTTITAADNSRAVVDSTPSGNTVASNNAVIMLNNDATDIKVWDDATVFYSGTSAPGAMTIAGTMDFSNLRGALTLNDNVTLLNGFRWRDPQRLVTMSGTNTCSNINFLDGKFDCGRNFTFTITYT